MQLPAYDDLPLYVFAMCRYRMPQSVQLERGETSTFVLNSVEQSMVPESVNLKSLAKLPKTRTVFEDFSNGIQDWSTRDQRSIKTYKLCQMEGARRVPKTELCPPDQVNEKKLVVPGESARITGWPCEAAPANRDYS